MPDQAGFEIKNPEAEKGRFYPLTLAFKLGDPPLAEKVTGLSWPEFVDRLPDEDTDPNMAQDLVAMSGLLAIAVSHEHPQWRRDRVVSYIAGVPLANITFHAGEDTDVAEGDPRPPDKEAGQKQSESSASPSKHESDVEPSADQTPASSGSQLSAIGSA